MSDQVPVQVSRMKICTFAQGLLYAVLTEVSYSHSIRRLDKFQRLGFGDSHQGDISRITSLFFSGPVDVCADPGDILSELFAIDTGYVVHATTSVGRRARMLGKRPARPCLARC